MPTNTKYRPSWETQFPWVKPVANDPFRASCKVCGTDFSVSNKGVQVLKQHDTNSTHKNNLKAIAGTPKIDMAFSGKCIPISHIVNNILILI